MHDRIQEFSEKLKSALPRVAHEWGVASVVFLVALGSFMLGRLSALEEARPVVSVREAPRLAAPRAMHIGGLIVASRSGEKYFFPWCSGAQSISEENKVWFKDESAAKAAGYEPAKNCKGLK